jgi:hypothetical protein
MGLVLQFYCIVTIHCQGLKRNLFVQLFVRHSCPTPCRRVRTRRRAESSVRLGGLRHWLILMREPFWRCTAASVHWWLTHDVSFQIYVYLRLLSLVFDHFGFILQKVCDFWNWWSTYIDYLVKFVFLSEPARQIGDQMGAIEVHGGSTRIARSSGKR